MFEGFVVVHVADETCFLIFLASLVHLAAFMEPNTKRKRGDFFREAVSSSKASITGVAKVLRVVKKALESDPSILKSASKSSVSRAIHEMTADEGLYGTISDTMQVQLADGSQYNWERK